ncbi:hypothetical protein [Bacillus haynesii]|uniref:hypothetical protein n=1 Tax=Bacillus haynesii TaxID=1925021 RepID=UPI00227DB083|nr:hypothetical protein [Bacillus haynesii]MCY7992294.1 hypothetical protein [Bacillus haynesii]MCY8553546.1 hypothetical protein [Bacillus haynesii]
MSVPYSVHLEVYYETESFSTKDETQPVYNAENENKKEPEPNVVWPAPVLLC